MREVALQVSSDPLDHAERAFIDSEYAELRRSAAPAGQVQSRPQGEPPAHQPLAESAPQVLGVGLEALRRSTHVAGYSALTSLDTAIDRVRPFDEGATRRRLADSMEVLESHTEDLATAPAEPSPHYHTVLTLLQ